MKRFCGVGGMATVEQAIQARDAFQKYGFVPGSDVEAGFVYLLSHTVMSGRPSIITPNRFVDHRGYKGTLGDMLRETKGHGLNFIHYDRAHWIHDIFTPYMRELAQEGLVDGVQFNMWNPQISDIASFVDETGIEAIFQLRKKMMEEYQTPKAIAQFVHQYRNIGRTNIDGSAGTMKRMNVPRTFDIADALLQFDSDMGIIISGGVSPETAQELFTEANARSRIAYSGDAESGPRADPKGRDLWDKERVGHHLDQCQYMRRDHVHT